MHSICNMPAPGTGGVLVTAGGLGDHSSPSPDPWIQSASRPSAFGDRPVRASLSSSSRLSPWESDTHETVEPWCTLGLPLSSLWASVSSSPAYGQPLCTPCRKDFAFPKGTKLPKQGKTTWAADLDSEEVNSQECAGTRESGRPQNVGPPGSSLCF